MWGRYRQCKIYIMVVTEIEIKDSTIQFIKSAKTLINEGYVKNYRKLSKLLGWNTSSLNDVLKLRRNVPEKYFLRLNERIKLNDFDDFGEVTVKEKSYALDQIMTALKSELIESYGGLSKDEQGNELQTPYMVIGIVKAAFDRLK